MHSFFCNMDCRVVTRIPCYWANAALVPWNSSNCLTILAFSATESFCIFYLPFWHKKFRNEIYAKQLLSLKTLNGKDAFPSPMKKNELSHLIGNWSVFSPAYLISTLIKYIASVLCSPTSHLCLGQQGIQQIRREPNHSKNEKKLVSEDSL